MKAFVDILLEHKEYKYHRHQEHTHRFVLSVSFTLSHAKKRTYHLDDERLVFRLRAWLGLILWGCTIWLGSYIYSLGSCQSVLLNCRICCSSYDNSPCAKLCIRSLSKRTELSLFFTISDHRSWISCVKCWRNQIAFINSSFLSVSLSTLIHLKIFSVWAIFSLSRSFGVILYKLKCCSIFFPIYCYLRFFSR